MESTMVTAFNLGQSVVVTIPKAYQVISGQKFKIKRDGLRLNLEPVGKVVTEKQLASKRYLIKSVGLFNFKTSLSVKQMNEQFDQEVYES